MDLKKQLKEKEKELKLLVDKYNFHIQEANKFNPQIIELYGRIKQIKELIDQPKEKK